MIQSTAQGVSALAATGPQNPSLTWYIRQLHRAAASLSRPLLRAADASSSPTRWYVLPFPRRWILWSVLSACGALGFLPRSLLESSRFVVLSVACPRRVRNYYAFPVRFLEVLVCVGEESCSECVGRWGYLLGLVDVASVLCSCIFFVLGTNCRTGNSYGIALPSCCW